MSSLKSIDKNTFFCKINRNIILFFLNSFEYVDPKNTSNKCSEYKYISKESRKSQSKFECVNCGIKINADLNASINILAEGLAVIACGVETFVFTLKQELELRKPILV